MFSIGITDHLEGPGDRPSGEVFAEVAELISLADSLGIGYAWFAEHHGHAHRGHLPAPLMFALHMAGQTRSIHLGAAVVCMNLHHPLEIAEQIATANVLSGGRMATGFGSGSTPEETEMFGFAEMGEDERHRQFEESMRTVLAAWDRTSGMLPRAPQDLPARCWMAVNSLGAARIAGRLNFNVLFSHLRTPQQYRQYISAYRAEGGGRKIAANRPVFVGENDKDAAEQAEPALRILWRRFQKEGKIPADRSEPRSIETLCAHPINCIVGGPERVKQQLAELHEEAPFDVLNAEVRWEGLPHAVVCENLRRLAQIYCCV
jgi:alkanesulfonate monooxygenase SsuD/methylene tetrahydromethanopterin reductase-like flavin-dependent oxidoreductase (luciferase family)